MSASTVSSRSAPIADEVDSDSDGVSTSSGSSASGDSYDSEDDRRLAAEEWSRLVDQTKLIVSIAVPFLAGFYGRKFGLKLFQRYLSVGLGKTFWFGWTGISRR